MRRTRTVRNRGCFVLVFQIFKGLHLREGLQDVVGQNIQSFLASFQGFAFCLCTGKADTGFKCLCVNQKFEEDPS